MARRPEAIAPDAAPPAGLTPEGSAERDGENGADYAAIMHDYPSPNSNMDESEGSESPESLSEGAFATGYANGEAVDVPVTPPAEPGELFPPLREPEMHDGREVNQHQVRFGGKALIGRSGDAERAFWASLRGGRRGYARVAFQVGDDGYASSKDRDGDVVSYAAYRKVKVDAIHIEGSVVEDEPEGQDDELEEAREEAAGYNETIIDWVTAARLVEAQFELADDELGDLVRGIAAYMLPGEVIVTADEPEPNDPETPEGSPLDQALAEAQS